MNHSIDNFLSEQTQQLELEKQRLYGGDRDADGSQSPIDGLDAGNNGAGGDNLADSLETAASECSDTSEKLKKDTLNHAMSFGGPQFDDQRSFSGRKSAQQQQNELDQRYNGESFYSHFPGFSNQNKQREQLVQDRHQDYRDHLSKIAAKEATETLRKAQNKQTYDDDHRDVAHDNPISGPYSSHHQVQTSKSPSKQQLQQSGGGPYDHKDMLDGLKHSSTVADDKSDQQSAGTIKDSNEEYAQESARRKMEYHRDLLKQIEDKKLEVKALRAREKAEEEQMTKRLEEQLKSIQLEEQLRRERKRSEQARISSEQNRIYRLHLLAKLENDKRRTIEHRSPERTAFSDNGPSVLPWSRYAEAGDTTDDDGGGRGGGGGGGGGGAPLHDTFDPRKAYKYFSNSAEPSVGMFAPAPAPPVRSMQAFHEEAHRLAQPPQLPPPPAPATAIHGLQTANAADYCKRCHDHIRQTTTTTTTTTSHEQQQRAACQYCERRRNNQPINEDFCLKCSVLLATQTERQNGMCANCRRTDLRCGFCQKFVEVCPACGAVFCLRCHRRQLRQIGEQELGRARRALDNAENMRPQLVYKDPSPGRQQQAPQTRGYDDRPIITHSRAQAGGAAKRRPVAATSHVVATAAAAANDPPTSDDSEHDVPASPPIFVRRDAHKPFSTNVPQTSIFHPQARAEEPRLAVNIRHGQLYVDEHPNSKYTTSYDAFPVPLMPATSHQPKRATPTKATATAPGRVPQPSAAVRRLQQKWEIPAVQKNVMTTRSNGGGSQPNRVLTQLGAIRRQLQLEQMEMDETQH